MSAHILTVDDFPRAMLINANERGGWRVQQDRKVYWRQRGVILGRGIPKMQRAQIDVWLRFPNNITRDASNWMPTLKALVDGLVNKGAGILPDDSDAYLEGPHLHREYPNGALQMKVAINELEAVTP